MVRTLAVAVLAVLLTGLLTGCGGGGLAPVKGQLVTPDGKPAKELAGCTVVFEGKTADGRATGATGEVDDEGRFELTTTKAGDGAPVGSNRVSINPRWRGSSERADPLPALDKYLNAETSGLTVDVKPGRNDDVKLTVELKPKKGKG